jgi:hypothetical protein
MHRSRASLQLNLLRPSQSPLPPPSAPLTAAPSPPTTIPLSHAARRQLPAPTQLRLFSRALLVLCSVDWPTSAGPRPRSGTRLWWPNNLFRIRTGGVPRASVRFPAWPSIRRDAPSFSTGAITSGTLSERRLRMCIYG